MNQQLVDRMRRLFAAGGSLTLSGIDPKLKKGSVLMLKGKKVAILGDRDGVPGLAIEECVKTAGADVVFSTTECFV
jgi:glycine reductase